MGLTDEYKRERDAAAEAQCERLTSSLLDADSRARHFRRGADWGYEKGRAEIRSRIAAMEAEVTAAENKTRTVQANAKEEIDRLTAELKAHDEYRQSGPTRLFMAYQEIERLKAELAKAKESVRLVTRSAEHFGKEVERLTEINRNRVAVREKLESEIERLKAELAEAKNAVIAGVNVSVSFAEERAKRQGEPAKCELCGGPDCYDDKCYGKQSPAAPREPREWWIYCRAKDEIIVPESAVDESNDSANFYHVIEKSAYDKLREENEELKARAENYQKTMVAQAKTISIYIDEKDALKAECEKLANALSYVSRHEHCSGDPKVRVERALTNYAAFKEGMK